MEQKSVIVLKILPFLSSGEVVGDFKRIPETPNSLHPPPFRHRWDVVIPGFKHELSWFYINQKSCINTPILRIPYYLSQC